MSLPYPTPNFLVRNHDGMTTFHFGKLHSITPNSLCKTPHIEVHFVGGVRVELTPETAAELARDIPGVLARLPFIPELWDAAGGHE